MAGRKQKSWQTAWWRIALVFGGLFFIFWWAASQRVDPDFGWHLQAGNYIREKGIPKYDIFTYTAPDFEWINHEWASDTLLSLLYGVGGVGLLVIIYSLLWTLVVMINGAGVRLFTLLVATAALLPYTGVRATIWALVFLTALLKLSASRYRYAIIPLFFVWANFHGSFIVGLAVVGYLLLKHRTKAWLLILAGSLLATFINPYGIFLYEEVFRTLFDRSLRVQISEWHMFKIYPTVLLFFLIWTSGFWLFSRRRLAEWLSLGPIFFLAAMSASRNLPLFVVITIKNADDYLTKLKNELPDALPKTKKALIWLVVIGSFLWLGYANRSYFRVWRDGQESYPNTAITYLQSNPCPGRLFNHYDFGGYLIWKLPSYKVYIDGRMPSWRDPSGEKYIDRYFRLDESQNERNREFAKFDIRCALVERNSDIAEGLKKDGWQIAVSDAGAVLLLKP